MKSFLFLCFALALSFIGVAQDTTDVVVEPGTSWLAENWELVLTVVLAIYEVIARLVPTVNNISLLSLVMKMIAAIVPNKRAETSVARGALRSEAGDKIVKTHEVIS